MAQHPVGDPGGTKATRVDPRTKRWISDPYLALHQRNAPTIYRRVREEASVYHHPERGISAISRFEDGWNARLDLHNLSTEGIEETQKAAYAPHQSGGRQVLDRKARELELDRDMRPS